MTLQETQEYYDLKLAHYNKWLLDPKREFGVPYPGYPEKKSKQIKETKVESTVIASMTQTLTKPAKASKAPARKVKRMGTSASPTKGDLALQIYKRLGGDKTAVIGELMTGLGMSQAGATTYFYNAKKAA